jgi:hypothetical protein
LNKIYLFLLYSVNFSIGVSVLKERKVYVVCYVIWIVMSLMRLKHGVILWIKDLLSTIGHPINLVSLAVVIISLIIISRWILRAWSLPVRNIPTQNLGPIRVVKIVILTLISSEVDFPFFLIIFSRRVLL